MLVTFSRLSTSAAGHAVQIACWLVRQNDSRLRYQSAGDGYTLLLAAGEIAGHIVQFILQPQHPHHFFHKLLVHLVSVQLHRQHNVFEDIQHRHQIVVLEDEADLSSAEDGQLLVFECGEVACPSTTTWPEVGTSSPPIMFSSVDLPLPEVPTMATNSPLLYGEGHTIQGSV